MQVSRTCKTRKTINLSWKPLTFAYVLRVWVWILSVTPFLQSVDLVYCLTSVYSHLFCTFAHLLPCAGCREHREYSVSGSTGGSAGFTWSPMPELCPCKLHLPSLLLTSCSQSSLPAALLWGTVPGQLDIMFYSSSPTLATLKTRWLGGWNPSWLSWVGTILSCRIVYGYPLEVPWNEMCQSEAVLCFSFAWDLSLSGLAFCLPFLLA